MTFGENSNNISGSPMTLSVISASINSALISSGSILLLCAISASVFVRSTSVLRPSSSERRRIVICSFSCSVESEVGGVLGGEKEGRFGARTETLGQFEYGVFPKYACRVLLMV